MLDVDHDVGIVEQHPPPVAAASEADVKAALGAAKKEDKDAPKPLPDSPLRSFCWALLSSNEFLFID